mmetsp:Transcript_28868/g.72653  ORF Transcript_28868/g.72653 Transcript_28868/m.72653 type:complete len:259 (-) Transcript_28868:455-1231(-)
MDQHRQHLLALAVADEVLLAAHLALHNRVDRLQVRGVGHHRDVYLAVRGHAVMRRAQVVLHVPAEAAVLLAFQLGPLELAEDILQGLADHICQHVETATMRHPDDNFIHTQLGATVDHCLHPGDHGLTTIQAKALSTGVLLLKKSLKQMCKGQTAQNLLFFLGRVFIFDNLLHLVSDPITLITVWNMHVLDPDVATIGVPHLLDVVAQSHPVGIRIQVTGRLMSEVNLFLQISLSPPICFDVQLRKDRRFVESQGVKI